jgi:hypothetical protein
MAGRKVLQCSSRRTAKTQRCSGRERTRGFIDGDEPKRLTAKAAKNAKGLGKLEEIAPKK